MVKVQATSNASQELLGLVSTANDRALKREIRRAPIADKVKVASSLGYPGDMSMDVLDSILLQHIREKKNAPATSGPSSAPPGGVKTIEAVQAAIGKESKNDENNLRAALRDAQSRLTAMAEERDRFAEELDQCRAERDQFRDAARCTSANRSTRATPEASLIEALGDKVSGLEQERIVLHARVNNSARRNEKLEQQVAAQALELARARQEPPRTPEHHANNSGGLWAAPCSPADEQPGRTSAPTQQALPLEEARKIVDDVTVASRTAEWVRPCHFPPAICHILPILAEGISSRCGSWMTLPSRAARLSGCVRPPTLAEGPNRLISTCSQKLIVHQDWDLS
ncbi:hypothetical protein T484DRAFT_2585346 [Baffinella frigidus]|nr:hypothetical protein T484DRAFT_2585346 [Cryptophyta sp. CCMP2293]